MEKIILLFPPWPAHTRMNTKINKYARTKQPICICASCNLIYKELGLDALAHKVCVHKQRTHRWKHVPQWRNSPSSKCPDHRGGRHGKNCLECKKVVPPFYSHPSFSSPHLTRSLTSCSDCLRGEKDLVLYGLISFFFYHPLKNKLLRWALKSLPDVSLSPCDSVKHKISWMQLRGQCRCHRADFNPAGERVGVFA